MQPLDPLTLPLRGRILIEASAGTGKTYTLALLFVRLLLERELSVDRILVVTFTTAATEELRGRIRLRIREALDTLEGGGPDDEALQRLMAGVRKNNPAGAAILLSDALTRMDEAAIFTIHGFCRRMLQEHAFESGAPFSLEFLENEQSLRMEIMEDFWRSRFYTGAREEAVWAASLWPTPQDLYNALGGHLSRPGVRCVPVIEDAELVRLRDRLRPLFAEIRTLWQQQGDTISSLLKENKRLSRNNTTGYGDKRLAAALTAMDDFTHAESMPWLLAGPISLFSVSAMDRALKKNKHAPPEHRFFDLVDRFLALHNEMTRCRKISILLAAREYLHGELRRRKQEQARLYFDDLLLEMDAALRGAGSEKFAADISTRFPAILVDEFQDTDPLQYHIFSRIHQTNPPSALFLIGDPKQAIYGFRGADIFTYLAARQETPPENRYTMTTNYRSTGPMVAMVNRLFDRENPFLLAADAMKFTRVQAAGSADAQPLYVDNRPIAPLTCLLLPEQQSGKPLSKDEATKQAARFCAHEIVTLLTSGKRTETKLNDRSLTGGDIGILVRTHREAETMRNALAKCNIASVYSGKSSVFQSREAEQILTLLCTLQKPDDTNLARTLLTTDLFGYDAPQLEQLHHEEQSVDEITATLHRYRQILLQQGFMPMFHTLLADAHNVGRLTALPNGERILTNFLHLAELLQEASANITGIEGLRRRLVDWIRRPDEQQEDSSQLRLESDENLVKIVTIHKSKGLEYPVVFLPFLWSTRTCSPKEPFSFHHPDRPEQLCVDLGSGNEEHFRLAERERLAADLRLLYVALTRARHSCFFCWGVINKMEETALCRLLHGGKIPDRAGLTTDLDQLRDHTAGLVVKQPTENQAPVLKSNRLPETALAAARFTGSIDTSRRITSYSGMTAGHDSGPERPDYDDRGGPLPRPAGFTAFGFPKGPAAGTCLHAIFERISFTDPADHQAIAGEQLARAGFEQQWRDVVAEWIGDVLAAELENGFSLNMLEDKQRINEMAFTFPLEKMRFVRFNRALAAFDIAPLPEQHSELQGLMIGFIDLIFRWNHRYYIADYKSNYLGDCPEQYGAKELEAAMLEHRYDLQYLIYTLALHRFLGSRMADYDYERHFGGTYYLFLRGMNPHYPAGTGVFTAKPPLALIRRLDACCRGEEVSDA